MKICHTNIKETLHRFNILKFSSKIIITLFIVLNKFLTKTITFDGGFSFYIGNSTIVPSPSAANVVISLSSIN